MILLGISVVGFVPARFFFHVIMASTIYAVYLVPILLTETIASHREFLISNAFMVLIFSTMLLMRYLSGKSFVAELGLQYDLEQHREHLEAVVKERTAVLVETVEKLKTEIAERQRLQDQLVHAQKLESVGRLAGGVAHDFNNLLTAILSYAELSLMRLADEDPLRRYLVSIQEASEKAAGLTHQLLAFSRKQVLEMKEVDLNDIVVRMKEMLTRMIGEDIILEVRTSPAVRSIRADKGQLEQILMNLVVNARDAMPAGGRLLIETAVAVPDDAFLQSQGSANPSAYVILSVTDSGPGMSPEVRDRIFEPFFTTKEPGQGTGMGLATVYGIVKQHDGHVLVESSPGKGTVFRIYLPLIEPQQAPGTGAPLPRGTETLLVVEDDESVRDLVRDVLSPLGYQVLVTASGEDALRASDAHQGNIHLLLTDVIMPGMNGRQLAEVLGGRRPGIKALFMSGYTEDVLHTQGMIEHGMALILKPLRPGPLARHVRQVLDSGR
jgi:signal transduction histidine kinase